MEGTNQTPITDLDVDVLDIPSPTQLSQYVATSKRKNLYKMISIVWDHFTKIPKPDRAKCNYCNREFGCDSTQGTSTLKRHLEKCTRYPYGNKEKQQVLSFSVSSEQGGTTVSTWKFDQELCRRELARWGLEKICTVTVDNCSSNDVAIRNLQKRLKKKNSLLLDGEFLHMRCCAYILNLIVRDGIEEVKTSVASIRNAIRHVKSSPSRLQQFKLCANQEKISCTKTICLDVCTRWNSTFLMLQSALEFQKAFERLADLDCNFQFSLKDGPPTDEDWDRAKVLCRFLERFYISTKKLSGSLYITANVYFHEVYAIEVILMQGVRSDNPCLRDMASKMKEKYDKYWGKIERANIMVLVAVVLDPRYKLKYLEFCYSKIHAVDDVAWLIERVKDVMDRLLRHYQSIEVAPDGPDVPSTQFNQPIHQSGSQLITGDCFEFQLQHEYRKQLEEQENVQYGSELDPRDVLAIPVSTVASESAFSSGGRVLDQFRSSLTPKLVESLICTKDWLRSSSTPIEIDEILEELDDDDVESGVTGDGALSD
ncbi:zinc finger BED domain-containing protein RICESLEEPER 2-like [Tasmannia lanceolata]|uniref:zinc finger BED domain-containing protein RICESLEEPER 2-like n=1 Tax=Tasmannia lanceolata TaxID=3420 RepID=UPI004063EF7B